jgi:hypothetical protein
VYVFAGLFDSCWDEGSPELQDYEDKILLSKAVAWQYEDEFREIFTLSSHPLTQNMVTDKCTGSTTTVYFLPFLPEAIVSVTLGPRCSSDFEKEVQTVLRNSHFSHVKLDRAILNKNDFQLHF